MNKNKIKFGISSLLVASLILGSATSYAARSAYIINREGDSSRRWTTDLVCCSAASQGQLSLQRPTWVMQDLNKTEYDTCRAFDPQSEIKHSCSFESPVFNPRLSKWTEKFTGGYIAKLSKIPGGGIYESHYYHQDL